MKQTTWQDIRDQIAQEIYDGTLAAGERLPVEPVLAERFGAGRHSVRRAVADLARQGKLRVEQGRGTFVEDAPLIRYPIGKRTRLRDNLSSQGYDASGDLLGFDTVPARHRVAEALAIDVGDMVFESRRVTYANAVPIATGASYHAHSRFPDLVRIREDAGSMTETYRHYGITDYLRGATTMVSRLAKPIEAKLLQQRPDMPVIVLRSVDTLLDGTPIAFSEVTWAATRVQFEFTNEATP